MDLESECSVVGNELVTPECLGITTIIGTDGTCHDTDSEGGGVKSPSAFVCSPGCSIGMSPKTVAKGVGLKKWKRFRREGGNEVGSNLGRGKPLKRGLFNSVENANSRTLHVSSEVKQKSEGSVSSTNAVVKVLGNVPDGVAIFGGRPNFEVGTDSENSGDRSSKSSTAASAPRSRYEMPSVVGYGRDKIRGISGNNLGSFVMAQKSVHRGKGRVENSKKARGDRVKIEKENSHYSLESDSRSSNYVFMQGPHSLTSNGRPSARSANYDGENSDDAQEGEQLFNEDNRTGFGVNEAESEDGSQEDLAAGLSWGMNEDKSENHGSSIDQDALMEPIVAVQSVQEALEKELEKLRHTGKDDTLFSDDLVQGDDFLSEFNNVGPEVDDPSSSDHESLEKQMISLKQNVLYLETKLMEATMMFDMKEAKAIELEAILNSIKSPKEERRESSTDIIEAELEGIFRLKIEAEIEYLAIAKTIQKLRGAVVDQITLLEEQRAIASKQVQVLNKLEDAESKATILKEQAEKLEINCEEIVDADEIFKLQIKVSKFSWCFFIQLILLILVLGLFVSQLSPHFGGVVPT